MILAVAAPKTDPSLGSPQQTYTVQEGNPLLFLASFNSQPRPVKKARGTIELPSWALVSGLRRILQDHGQRVQGTSLATESSEVHYAQYPRLHTKCLSLQSPGFQGMGHGL